MNDCSSALITYPTAAHKLYPVRVCVINVVSKEFRWITVAYTPLVRIHVDNAAEEGFRLCRCGILQRFLFVCMRTAMATSWSGAEVREDGRQLMAFFRFSLHVCDRAEKRAVLFLKACSFQRPCSHCDLQIDVSCLSKAQEAT